MKVILTGNTGLIGSEVLSQCLSNPTITSIVALSRKDLPITHPKLTQIQHSDFTSYPPSLLSQLAGAEVCIFSLGIARAKTPEDGQRINQDFPLAAAKAFADFNKPFKFIYVSGTLVEKDQNKKLWVLSGMRKMRGRTELELLKIGKEKSGFEVRIMRPGFVGAMKGSVKDGVIKATMGLIRVDVLARAMVGVATEGHGDGKEIFEMDELMRLGKEGK